MRLADPAAVLTVLGIQSSEGSLNAAGAALDATFPRIESLLDSSLLRATRRDLFDIGANEVRYGALFRLSSGFLVPDEDLVFSAYGDVVVADNYLVDHDIGTLGYGLAYETGRRAGDVTYTYGFEVDTDEITLKDVPDALKQGGILMAAAFMMLNPANIAKEKAKFMASVTVAGLELNANKALSRYIRPRGLVVWPAYSGLVT